MRTTMDLPFASLICFLLIYPALAFSPRLDKWIARAMTREQVVQQIEKPACVSSKEVAALIPDESANSKIGLADTQRQASWGLARISHRQKLDFGTFNRYEFDSTAGNGTNVYVLDSGIYTDHAEFEARASWGTTIASGSGSVDTIGHGTHCAGTIASKKYGVAKKSNLIAVKVLDDNLAGVTSDFIGGLEWAVTDQQQRSAASIIFFNPGIAGLSSLETRLEDNPSDLTAAINAAIDAGIQVVVPAGNGNQDICSTPIGQSNAVIVGASTLSDEIAYFSNYGSCTTLFAPGLNIQSTYVGSETSISVLSGTEMAAAHVAGLLAYLQSLQPELLAPADLKSLLLNYATKGVFSSLPTEDTPNLLAYNNIA